MVGTKYHHQKKKKITNIPIYSLVTGLIRVHTPSIVNNNVDWNVIYVHKLLKLSFLGSVIPFTKSYKRKFKLWYLTENIYLKKNPKETAADAQARWEILHGNSRFAGPVKDLTLSSNEEKSMPYDQEMTTHYVLLSS